MNKVQRSTDFFHVVEAPRIEARITSTCSKFDEFVKNEVAGSMAPIAYAHLNRIAKKKEGPFDEPCK